MKYEVQGGYAEEMWLLGDVHYEASAKRQNNENVQFCRLINDWTKSSLQLENIFICFIFKFFFFYDRTIFQHIADSLPDSEQKTASLSQEWNQFHLLYFQVPWPSSAYEAIL